MISPMEARMMGEVSRAVTGMSRIEVNELVKYCLEQYEPTLGNPPKGQRYQDLYDLSRMQPHDQWLELFETVKADLKAHGIHSGTEPQRTRRPICGKVFHSSSRERNP